ncbi:MAG: TspO/MBR family protein [Pseudomonadota bacterium]
MSNLLIIVLLVIATASSGGFFKPDEWYFNLDKPSWTPPPWAFPVVWTVLYVAIAAAAYIVIQSEGWGWLAALWVVHLGLNAAWSGFFFGMRRMDIAFVDVCFLWTSIAVLIVLFAQVSLLASLLMVPYLIWVTTAAALNWQVWSMNPDATSRA